MQTSLFSRLGWMTLATVLLQGATLRAEEDRPLIVFQISEAALNRSLSEPIERTSDVDDFLLETHVLGTAKTLGVPHVSLIENPEGASFKAQFKGTTVARTAGHHPPVVIYSRSQTDFTAEKIIEIEQLGAVIARPTIVQAKTTTTTENITTSRRGPLRRIVLRKAWSAVEAKRGEANAFAQHQAEERVVEAFDSALEARLAKLERQIAMRIFVSTLLPANSTPAYRSFTQDGYLTIAVFPKAPPERKVSLELPKLPLAGQPMQVWVHQEVIGKNIDSALGSLAALRHLVTFPSLSFLAAPNLRERGPQWTVVDDWFVVQLAGLDK